ncbi:MAG: hypothetical protein Satyrvirus48_5, partial [Satyrvirus sp.]
IFIYSKSLCIGCRHSMLTMSACSNFVQQITKFVHGTNNFLDFSYDQMCGFPHYVCIPKTINIF